jgi:hypothetical protein
VWEKKGFEAPSCFLASVLPFCSLSSNYIACFDKLAGVSDK